MNDIRLKVNAIRADMQPLEEKIEILEAELEVYEEKIYELQDLCPHTDVEQLYFNPYHMEGRKRCKDCDYEWNF